MFLVEQRSDDGIDGNRFTGSRSTRDEQVRRLREVKHKDLVGDRTSVSDRQTHLCLLLEPLGSNHRVHGHHLRFLIRHFNTDRSLARHRRNDTDTRSREGHHYIVLQSLDLRHANTGFRHNLIERNGRSDSRFDGVYLNAVVTQGRHDTGSVTTLLVLIDHRSRLVVIHLEQIERRELKELQVLTRIVRTEFL